MRRFFIAMLGVLGCAATFAGTAVMAQTAPNWKSLPMACLPDRAIPWDSSKPGEAQQYNCHCPPANLCPSDITATSPSTTLPPGTAVRCCPLPACPDAGGRDENGVCIPITVTTSGDGGGGDGGGDCIGVNSPVSLATGQQVPIGDLKPGDTIKGPGGEVVVGAVTHTTKKNPLFYSINDLSVVVTGEHPLLTDAGWKAIDPEGKYIDPLKGRLQVGDVLVTHSGKITVKSIEVLPNANAVKAVNIHTKEDKPFYVDGVVVKPFKDMEFTY
jgi:hypothetical protein